MAAVTESAIFDRSSQFMEDSDVDEFCSNLPREAFADFSYNRLTIDSVKVMVEFLLLHSSVKFCIKGNNFSFDEFYTTLSRLKAENLFYERRLCMSHTELEWRLEQLAFDVKHNDTVLKSTSKLIRNHSEKSGEGNFFSVERKENVELRFDTLVESNRIRNERFDQLFTRLIKEDEDRSR